MRLLLTFTLLIASGFTLAADLTATYISIKHPSPEKVQIDLKYKYAYMLAFEQSVDQVDKELITIFTEDYGRKVYEQWHNGRDRNVNLPLDQLQENERTLIVIVEGYYKGEKAVKVDSFLRKIPEKTYAQKQSEVRKYAKLASENIMSNLGGGTNLTYDIRDWKYFSHDKEYQINLTVSYYGKFWSDTHYYLEGRLTVNQGTGKVNLATTFKNQAVKDLESRNRWLGGVIFVLDKVLSETN